MDLKKIHFLCLEWWQIMRAHTLSGYIIINKYLFLNLYKTL